MAGHRPVVPDELYSEISRAISKEVEEIEESVEYAAKVCAYELRDNIRADSPQRSGEYKKGWKVTKLTYSYVVHNKNKPEITHLLEKGHLKRNGTDRVDGIPHIKKNEKHIADKFEDMCVAIVSEGVRYKNGPVPRNL